MASRKKSRKPARRAGKPKSKKPKKSVRRPAAAKRRKPKTGNKAAKKSARRAAAKRGAKRPAKKASRRPAIKKKQVGAGKSAPKVKKTAARPARPKQANPSPFDIAPAATVKPAPVRPTAPSWPASNYTPAVEQPKPTTGSLWPEEEDETEDDIEGTAADSRQDSNGEDDETT